MHPGDNLKTQRRNHTAKKLFKKPKGLLEPVDLNGTKHPEWMTRAFKNNRYVVMINDSEKMSNGIIAILAMVQRHDNKPIPNHWREMQAIKNELFSPEAVGIEYYPAESQLIDHKNIYWLWILPVNALPLRLKP